MAARKERAMQDFYREQFGEKGVARFREVAEKVKTGKMIFRQAAATLGITYYEFVSLLDEAGELDA